MSLEDLRNAGNRALQDQAKLAATVESQSADDVVEWAKALSHLASMGATTWQWQEFSEMCDVSLPIALEVANEGRDVDDYTREQVTMAWTWMCDDYNQKPDAPIAEVVEGVIAVWNGS